MADRPTPTRVVHHVFDGETVMYHVDARHALTFKDEWKDRPWRDHEVEAAKKRLAKKAKGEAEELAPVEADEAGEE